MSEVVLDAAFAFPGFAFSATTGNPSKLISKCSPEVGDEGVVVVTTDLLARKLRVAAASMSGAE
jgi:hypothetical protein